MIVDPLSKVDTLRTLMVEQLPTDAIDIVACNSDRDEDEYVFNIGLMSLANSIDEVVGMLMNPILVCLGENGRYDVVAGRRRLGAFRLLQRKYKDETNEGKYDYIPAIVLAPSEAGELRKIAMTIHENKERTSPTAIGQLRLHLSAMSFISGSAAAGEAHETVISKGLAVFNYGYAFNAYGTSSESLAKKLSCSKDDAIKAYSLIISEVGVSSVTIMKRIKILQSAESVALAHDAGWISLTEALLLCKSMSSSVEIKKAMEVAFSDAKKLGTDDSEAKQRYRESAITIEKAKAVKPAYVMPKREMNRFKKVQREILEKVSMMDKANPRWPLIRDHMTAIKKILANVG